MISIKSRSASSCILLVIATVAMFFSVYGFKVLGYIDTMVLVPMLLAAFLVVTAKRKIMLPKQGVLILVFVCLVLAYSLIIAIVSDTSSSYLVMRSFRAFMAGGALFFIFYFLAKKGAIDNNQLFNIMLLVFVFGAGMVYLQAFVPATQVWSSTLWGFNKGYRYLRAPGMSAGYDTTGFLLAWFASLSLLHYLRFRSPLTLFVFAIVAGAVLFTSRTSMFLLGFLLVLVFVTSKKYYHVYSPRIILIFVGIFVLSYFIVFPILYHSFILQQGDAIVIGRSVSERFAVTGSFQDAIKKHYFLPQETTAFIFGTGMDVRADPGYTKTIFLGGIVLLVLYVLTYISVFLITNKAIKNTKSDPRKVGDHRWNEVWLLGMTLLLFVLMFGNLKNLYFFTRGYHELFFVLAGSMLGLRTRWRELFSMRSKKIS